MYREFDIGESISGTPYRVIGLIGQGGMGSVYEVEHRELGKRFVLKGLLRELVSRNDLVQRLRNEWRALGKLEHPNIVSVTDAGVTETGVPYYVMERLYGVTLGQRLRGQGTLTVSETCEIAAEILDGLSAAHAIGVVHRDVKPPNVFLTKNGAVKILDFGIAKLLDGNTAITARGYAIGTPRYMSPEQASGGSVDARADLYAVGLLIFEMLSGQSPFQATDSKDLFMAHIVKPPPVLADVVPSVPSELSRLVARLLEKDPKARPGSAKGVAEILRAMTRSVSSPPGDTQSAPLSGALTPVVNQVASTRRDGAARVQVHQGVSGEGPTEARPSHPGAFGSYPPSSGGARTASLSQLDARVPATRTSAPVPNTPPPVANSHPALDPITGEEIRPPARSLTGVAIAAGLVGAVAAVSGIWLFVPQSSPAAQPVPAGENAPLVDSPLQVADAELSGPKAGPSAAVDPSGAPPREVLQAAPEPTAEATPEAKAPQASPSLPPDSASESTVVGAERPAPPAPEPVTSTAPPKKVAEPSPAPPRRERKLPSSGIPGF